MTDTPPILEVRYQGTCWSLVPGGTDARSYFGGSHPVDVGSRVDFGAAIIHPIATIHFPKFGVGNPLLPS